MKAEAYKAGDVESGNWNWAVGLPRFKGSRPSQMATINSTACYAHKMDPERLAMIMADALSAELEKMS